MNPARKLVEPLLIVALLAAGQPAAQAIEVREVTVEYREDRYYLFGESIIAAPRELIFDVLTDYDNFHLMADGITETKFLYEDGEQLGYTRIDTCVLFFCRAVEKVERVEAERATAIRAEAIPERSHYRISDTRWQFEPVDGGTRVTYIAEVRPSFWMPTTIGTWALRRALRDSAETIGINIEYLHEQDLTLKQYARISRAQRQAQSLKPTPKLR